MLHSNLVSFIVIFLSTVSVRIDSMYTLFTYSVRLVVVKSVRVTLIFISKLSILYREEELLYVKLIGMSPGKVTFQFKCGVSVLVMIEQLYDTVSPGQYMSPLLVFIKSVRFTNAEDNQN